VVLGGLGGGQFEEVFDLVFDVDTPAAGLAAERAAVGTHFSSGGNGKKGRNSREKAEIDDFYVWNLVYY